MLIDFVLILLDLSLDPLAIGPAIATAMLQFSTAWRWHTYSVYLSKQSYNFISRINQYKLGGDLKQNENRWDEENRCVFYNRCARGVMFDSVCNRTKPWFFY